MVTRAESLGWVSVAPVVRSPDPALLHVHRSTGLPFRTVSASDGSPVSTIYRTPSQNSRGCGPIRDAQRYGQALGLLSPENTREATSLAQDGTTASCAGRFASIGS